jgi:heme a synthase
VNSGFTEYPQAANAAFINTASFPLRIQCPVVNIRPDDSGFPIAIYTCRPAGAIRHCRHPPRAPCEFNTAMPRPRPLARPVALWLWCVAGLVFTMVLVGGATRLTQSGLSIVEWRPITGAVPPLSQADWQAEFAKYQTIPQYERLNRGMSLDEFKAIYWWEWGHRLLGRLSGVVFAIPFLWFLWRRAIDHRLATALAGIFVLGGVQGAVGWWMVSSGLTERVSVSQYRLAFHLTLACLIYAALVAAADRLWPRAPEPAGIVRAPQRLRLTAVALLGLVIGQIFLGALVAGLHAGLIYDTWPLIDGAIVPPVASLFFEQPAWRNFFENTLTVQFDHRMVAYVIIALALFHAIDAHRNAGSERIKTIAGLLVIVVLGQVTIGIMTLVHGVPIGLALLHQAIAMVTLTVATLNARAVFCVVAGGTVGLQERESSADENSQRVMSTGISG